MYRVSIGKCYRKVTEGIRLVVTAGVVAVRGVRREVEPACLVRNSTNVALNLSHFQLSSFRRKRNLLFTRVRRHQYEFCVKDVTWDLSGPVASAPRAANQPHPRRDSRPRLSSRAKLGTSLRSPIHGTGLRSPPPFCPHQIPSLHIPLILMS